MRKVVFFMMTTANGLYERGRWTEDPNGIDWHNTDQEFDVFAADQLGEADTLLFGRVTYQGMASYWPTPEAIASDPGVAQKMNGLEKVVFSRTLTDVSTWSNTRLANIDLAAEIARLKSEPGRDILILASSDLSIDLAAQNLIDEYRLLLNPILIGKGKPVLQGLPSDVKLKLLDTRVFANGNILLSCAPATVGEPALHS